MLIINVQLLRVTVQMLIGNRCKWKHGMYVREVNSNEPNIIRCTINVNGEGSNVNNDDVLGWGQFCLFVQF